MTNEPDIITPFDQAPDVVETEPNASTDLDAVRALVLRAHPDVVPDMIAGDSVEALLASIEPARAAWRQVADRIGASAAPPSVPAGGQPAVAVDPDRLSPSEKIRRGLAERLIGLPAAGPRHAVGYAHKHESVAWARCGRGRGSRPREWGERWCASWLDW